MLTFMHRKLACTLAATLFASVCLAGPKPRVATFKVDATPWKGEPLIWVQPATRIDDPLLAKGVVLEDGGARYVLCALDWCATLNSTNLRLRSALASAIGTDPSHVVVQSLHLHTAPYTDLDAGNILRARLEKPPLLMSDKFFDDLCGRLGAAAKEALGRMQAFDRVGTGEARVERVASSRRVRTASGKIMVRWSSNGGNKKLAEAPEGRIDPIVKTITLAAGTRPLVRLHYYATHPQTYCCDGSVTWDVVGRAREAAEQKEKVFQIYFTGCSGDVTMGKYNDASPAAKAGLAERLETGLEASDAATRYGKVGKIAWRTAPLVLPKPANWSEQLAAVRAMIAHPEKASGTELYRAALLEAWEQRKEPLEVSALQIGKIRIVHLPGEPSIGYQLYAQQEGHGKFVAVAGYGDGASGYMVEDKHFAEGGYEPTMARGGVGSEARIKKAIDQVLGK
jgi:hypothetical protein